MPAKPDLPAHAEVIARAIELHRKGKLDEAESLYQQVLSEQPENADALHFLGVLHHQRGDSDKAANVIRCALSINPEYLGARLNLGNVLKESERFEDAEAEYRQVLKTDPTCAEAHNNLGIVLRILGDPREAILSFRRAIELIPTYADALSNLGNIFKSEGEIELAATAYRKAIENDPKHANAYFSLGSLLYELDRPSEAAELYRKWLESDPNNARAKHLLNANEGTDVPDRCSDEYVRQEFDEFASSFEVVLQRLNYRAPSLLGSVVRRLFDPDKATLDVLDAGCGTGLCGKVISSVAKRLVGIDLSPKMLIKARSTKIYDELLVSELTQYMNAHPNCFDLVISGDTLIYFGKLEEATKAAANTLRGGGSLLFTLEQLSDDTEQTGYKLHVSGRYRHTESYARECLESAGLNVRSIDHEIIRHEYGNPVSGLVISAVKTSDDSSRR